MLTQTGCGTEPATQMASRSPKKNRCCYQQGHPSSVKMYRLPAAETHGVSQTITFESRHSGCGYKCGLNEGQALPGCVRTKETALLAPDASRQKVAQSMYGRLGMHPAARTLAQVAGIHAHIYSVFAMFLLTPPPLCRPTCLHLQNPSTSHARGHHEVFEVRPGLHIRIAVGP